MSGSSIGKRYARFDELGVPFAITVDFETAALKSATVRERDSKRRVRVSLSNIAATISALCKGTKTFQDLISELGEVGKSLFRARTSLTRLRAVPAAALCTLTTNNTYLPQAAAMLRGEARPELQCGPFRRWGAQLRVPPRQLSTSSRLGLTGGSVRYLKQAETFERTS